MSTEIKKQISMHEEEIPDDWEENQGLAESVPLQALQFIRAELLRTQKSIKDLQSERRMLRKQLSRWAGAVQVLQETQEEGHSRLEAKIQALNDSSECMRTELQQLKHNVQNHETTVSELHTGKLTTRCNEYLPSKAKSRLSSANEKETPPGSKLKQGDNGKIFQMSNSDNWRVDDLSEIENPRYRNENVRNSLQPSCQTQHDYLKVQNKNTLLHMRHLCESLKAAESFKHQERTGEDRHILNRAQLRPLKFTKSGDLNTCSSIVDAQKEQATMNNEEELHELVEKLKDALSAQIQPGNHHGLKQEFLYAAQQVCRSYSDLINQTIEPTLK